VSLSNAGTIVGTPLFMSPEEISTPAAVGPRSDLYSLGAVGYFLLCGEPVFTGTNVIEVCGHHLHTPPPPLSARAAQTVPADLERVLLDCLAKSPDARPASAQALAERLRACTDASAWSEQDARAWWRTHAAVTSMPLDGSADSRVLSVDLATRGGQALP
jgi:serine/threonine-protein kinase